jgi:hypothetical protein
MRPDVAARALLEEVRGFGFEVLLTADTARVSVGDQGEPGGGKIPSGEWRFETPIFTYGARRSTYRPR